MGLNGLLVLRAGGENCPRSRLCGRAVSVCAAVSLVRLLARRVCLCVSWRFRVRPSGKFSLSGTLCRRSRSSSTLSHGRWEPLDPSSLLFFTTIPPRRSAAMAAAAAAVDPALEAVFQSTREAVAALHVSPVATRRKAPGEGLASLDEVSVTDQLSTRPFFSLDLLFTGNIAAVPVANADVALASNDLAAFVAAAPTLQQRRQLAFSVRPANTKV